MRDRVRIAAWLAFAAELGHLAAAWIEAPGWPLISGFHVTMACFLGLIFAGLLKPEPRARTIRRATILAVVVPVLYILTRTLGLPTYVTFTRLPVDPVGVVVTVIELALAVLLIVRPARWKLGRSAAPTPSADAPATDDDPAADPAPASRAAR